MDAINQIIDTVRQSIDTIYQNIDIITQYAKIAGILLFGVLFFSSLFRFLFGKEAQVNKAFSSAVEIFCLYGILIVLHAFGWQWEQFFLSPLPFVSIEGDTLTVFPILEADIYATSSMVLKILVIAFLVNILNDVIPEGQHVITWYFFRILTVVLAVGANYLADLLFTMVLPASVMEIAPTILLVCLVALVLLGSLKLLVGVALVFFDPIIAALYTFFFATFIGRHLARAMVTTSLLTLLVVALDYFEISVFLISSSALLAYIPFLIGVLVVWYIVGHIL